jgi:hypothetical protein
VARLRRASPRGLSPRANFPLCFSIRIPDGINGERLRIMADGRSILDWYLVRYLHVTTTYVFASKQRTASDTHDSSSDGEPPRFTTVGMCSGIQMLLNNKNSVESLLGAFAFFSTVPYSIYP